MKIPTRPTVAGARLFGNGNPFILQSRIAALAEQLPERIAHEQTARQSVSDKLPNLGGIAGAIDKLNAAIEGDAKKLLERVEGVHAKRARVMGKADEKLKAREAALDATDAALDKLDVALGDNGGDPLDGSENPSQG